MCFRLDVAGNGDLLVLESGSLLAGHRNCVGTALIRSITCPLVNHGTRFASLRFLALVFGFIPCPAVLVCILGCGGASSSVDAQWARRSQVSHSLGVECGGTTVEVLEDVRRNENRDCCLMIHGSRALGEFIASPRHDKMIPFSIG
jgi:hypothetical protein